MRNAWDVREDAFVRCTNGGAEGNRRKGISNAFNYRRYSGTLQMFR